MGDKPQSGDKDEPVRLPLDPETALRALLAVKPDDEPDEKPKGRKPKKQ